MPAVLTAEAALHLRCGDDDFVCPDEGEAVAVGRLLDD